MARHLQVAANCGRKTIAEVKAYRAGNLVRAIKSEGWIRARLDPELVSASDTWIAKPPNRSRSAAIRAFVAAGLSLTGDG